ncbi:MAG: Asp-tRNA(Asn)/Glu-tRNA(Gln) amidotransferase subunit GatC [Deltaproteobacteria bacterium]|nr:Asp-tRNA(Asn)/Glu-tRNA(Gln) amidotransferase subunit GatC [Deltaproteobacteria bacterium]
MATVTLEEVQRVARLARLALSTHEAEAMTEHFMKVFTYVETLRTLDTDTTEPFTHAVTGYMPLREDHVTNTPNDNLLRTAPATHATLFVVPKIID